MKKLNKILIIAFSTLLVQFCTEPSPHKVYYQIKNETGKSVLIKFYYSQTTSVELYDSIYLNNNESSVEFNAMVGGGIGNYDIFILYSDSIDIYMNNVLIKKYKSPYVDSQAFREKTLYNILSYDSIIKSPNGYNVSVYTMLSSDFE